MLARYVAEHIDGARYVELPGYFVPTEAEAGALGQELDAFLSGAD